MIRYLIQLLNRNRAGDALAQDLIRDANNFPLVPAARRGLDFWIRGLATYLQLCFVFLTALSLALFVHSLFLTQFLPERLFETEVPMTFEPCAEHMGRCSFLRGKFTYVYLEYCGH